MWRVEGRVSRGSYSWKSMNCLSLGGVVSGLIIGSNHIRQGEQELTGQFSKIRLDDTLTCISIGEKRKGL
jgi:hypothetical protein